MEYHITSTLPSLIFDNKRVFLRADLNVPLNNGTILDDYRLLSIRPTIDLILKKGGHIILATHLGRPAGKPVAQLSTKQLIPWFEQHGYTISFCPTFADAKNNTKNSITLLENLRFFPGEQNQDHHFAQQLADLAEYYVNDAFGTLHRTDTSLTLVPPLFSKNHRTIGLLIEHELQALNALLENPQRPFIVIIGGGKVSTKIPLLRNLLPRINAILLCPAIAFTFMQALGQKTGNSLVELDEVEEAKKIMHEAKKNNVEILFPTDYQIMFPDNKTTLITVPAHEIPEHSIGIAPGHETLALFSSRIKTAKTIFFNAAFGFSGQPDTMKNLEQLLKIIAASSAYTVIGGGDSVGAVRRFGYAKNMSFLSTGGGATLAYLSGEKLPGLKVFEN